MTQRLARQIALLTRMTVKQLRENYFEAFGEFTSAANKDWLARRIAWRLQERAQGGLSERAKYRATELADAELRVTPAAARAICGTPVGAAVQAGRTHPAPGPGDHPALQGRRAAATGKAMVWLDPRRCGRCERPIKVQYVAISLKELTGVSQSGA